MSVSNQSIRDGKYSQNDPNLEKLFESILINRNASSDVKQEQEYINSRLTKLEEELKKERSEKTFIFSDSLSDI